MTRAARFSYFFLIAVIVLAAAIHLATPLVTVLFSYFALRKLYFGKRKWLSLVLFFVVVSATLYAWVFLSDRRSLPFPRSQRNRFHRLLHMRKATGSTSPFQTWTV